MRNRLGLSLHRLSALLPGGAALLALALAPSASAANPPAYQCPPKVQNCTTVTGTWVDVPGPTGGGIIPGTAEDELSCPSGTEPVGYTYSGGVDTQTYVFIGVFQNFPNVRDPWNPAAVRTIFFHIVNYADATTVQDRIGCAPPTGTQAPPPVRLEREHTYSVPLVPSKTRTYTHGCTGKPVASINFTVGFLGHRKPTRAQLTAVRVHASRHGNRDTFRVTTTKGLGHARAVLKMRIFCRA
jgi:hypothetical protein